MTGEGELEMLRKLFEGMGSGPQQAERLASQTLKRVDQLAIQRGFSREEAMQRMLRIIASGRSGSVPEGLWDKE